jgi:outer membrane lipoprotein carrier protein
MGRTFHHAGGDGRRIGANAKRGVDVYSFVRTLLLLLPAALLAVSAAPAQDLGAVIQGMELHYNRLGTLQTDFEQTLEYAGQVRAVERGTLYLYRPQKMRWEYTKPKGKLLVGDGERMRMYSPTTNQVRTVMLGDSADMRAPLAFLLGRLSLRRQFRNLELKSIDGAPALVGEGRSGQENYSRVEFFYNAGADFRLDRVRVFGRDDSVTTFTFDRENVNIRLDESMFVFEPPPGAEILPEQSAGAED